ncbi:cupin domain-containing protein [Thalassotalea nanhaiensis]|uniref:Cupin domain-containing protein n=1 Tax=Thalassotalea nanhaiensis TaxID=3065648 RepID=A0ABY9TJ95_9GAMM|nr:cupin domain-containing protein [Colwelliaceae bacterium SQ345]
MNNIFEQIPKDLSSEVFETIAKSDTIKIERIISKGHCSPQQGWYIQQNHEWVIVLQGEAIITFADNSKVTLSAGDYLNIKPLQKHKVSWTDPAIETIWLAIHYD